MASRDEDFSRKVIDTVSNRAGNKCSNPACNAITKGPKLDDDGVVNIGEAAHIYGAKLGSARHDPDKSIADSKNASNAVWLCANCHTKVDRDEKNFPPPLLKEWKRRVEEEAHNAIGNSGTTNREGILTALLCDLIDATANPVKAKMLMEASPTDLTQKEKAEIYEKFVLRTTGSSPESNPYKHRCQGCNGEFFRSELDYREVRIDRHLLMDGARVIPEKDHVERVSLCPSCWSEENWSKIERKLQNAILDARLKRKSRWGIY